MAGACSSNTLQVDPEVDVRGTGHVREIELVRPGRMARKDFGGLPTGWKSAAYEK
jgi:hypothetical protein